MISEEIIRIHCNECGRETKHARVGNHSQHETQVLDGGDAYGEQHVEIDWTIVYDLLECRGCETVAVRRRLYFSEWERDQCEETFYPPRVSRRVPNWAEDLPDEIRLLLLEIYSSLQADSRRLAVMGCRAVLDIFIVSKVGDLGSFKQKMDALQTEGFVGRLQRDLLEAVLDAGHAASHRAHVVSSLQLNQVMDIIENVLQADLLRPGAEELRRAVPPRPPRLKPAGGKGGGGTLPDDV